MSVSIKYILDSYEISGRPSTHSELPCVTKMVEEIILSKGINPIEVTICALDPTGTASTIANHITTGSFFLNNKIDICHKIPISSFTDALAKCMNSKQRRPNASSPLLSPWLELANLYATVDSSRISTNSSYITALANAVGVDANNLACTLAEAICNAFDSSHANLYFGNAGTNRSIGKNSDLHYDTLGGSLLPTPPTPRGASMESCLQILQNNLGLNLTKQITEVDSAGVWAMNSGVDGLKSQGTGYVLAK